jgi:archaellum component FlaC
MSAQDIYCWEQEEEINELEAEVERQKKQINDLIARLSAVDIKPFGRDDKLDRKYDSEVDQLEQKYVFLKDDVEKLYSSIFSNRCSTQHNDLARIDEIKKEISTKKPLMEIAKQEFEKAYWNEWEQKVERGHL